MDIFQIFQLFSLPCKHHSRGAEAYLKSTILQLQRHN